MENVIYFIRPASREPGDLLSARLPELAQICDRVIFHDHPRDELWPYTSGSIEARFRQLWEALSDERCRYIWCARGGYGCSDLLPLIDWQKLRARQRPPIIIGFSDISALHSAVYTQLGWVSMHAPMPATELWRKAGTGAEIDALIRDLAQCHLQTKIQTEALNVAAQKPCEGILFGGCLSVLTNLIGTSYLPKSFRDHILFFEDTGENPGRVQRMFNQWFQSGLFDNVLGIVLGDFRDSKTDDPRKLIAQRFADRCSFPVWSSKDFGHVAPNHPMIVGRRVRVTPNVLQTLEAFNNA